MLLPLNALVTNDLYVLTEPQELVNTYFWYKTTMIMEAVYVHLLNLKNENAGAKYVESVLFASFIRLSPCFMFQFVTPMRFSEGYIARLLSAICDIFVIFGELLS